MSPVNAEFHPETQPDQQDTIDPEAIAQALAGTRFAAKLHHFPTVTSTNSLLLAAAAQNAPTGTIYLADHQSAGRGRGGNTWQSSAESGLYVSILVRPQLSIQRALWISLSTALAAQSAVRDITGLTLDLRWPNDLMLGSKKCGGILVETALKQGFNAPMRHAVIGIGLNIGQSEVPGPLDEIATSLRIVSGRTFPRQPILIALLQHLDAELDHLAAPANTVLERFAAASTWVQGKRVRVAEAGGYTGLTAGLDPDGFLRVACDDGRLRTVLSGGVREAGSTI